MNRYMAALTAPVSIAMITPWRLANLPSRTRNSLPFIEDKIRTNLCEINTKSPYATTTNGSFALARFPIKSYYRTKVR